MDYARLRNKRELIFTSLSNCEPIKPSATQYMVGTYIQYSTIQYLHYDSVRDVTIRLHQGLFTFY